METTEKRLIDFFEEMRGRTKEFKKKTYDSVFKESYEKYKGLTEEISASVSEASPEEREALIEHFASVIPDYAFDAVREKYAGKKKNVKSRDAIDYNLCIVVYIVPILNYTKDESLEAVAKRLVELWNAKEITDMQISYSDYESISGGFKRKYCYITTAVCESRHKPDDCYELETLRRYRDDYLMKSKEGRALVEEYYDIAPALVMCVDMQKDRNQIYDAIYEEYLVPCIDDIEKERLEACKERYVSMVKRLSGKYLA